jgi:hypothetical protein
VLVADEVADREVDAIGEGVVGLGRICVIWTLRDSGRALCSVCERADWTDAIDGVLRPKKDMLPWCSQQNLGDVNGSCKEVVESWS